MARKSARTVYDDLGGMYARGEIDLSELNHAAGAMGAEATDVDPPDPPPEGDATAKK